MIKYWPYKQGIALNSEVANLFFSTRHKFSDNLVNQTNNNLYLDILDESVIQKLFDIVLTELEILILDIVELDLSLQHIKMINYKILYDLVQKAQNNFLLSLHNTSYLGMNLEQKVINYFDYLLVDHKLLLEYFLTYTIFGSSAISQRIFPFDKLYTPKEHVAILLENLIVQIGNIIIFTILESIRSLSNITLFIQGNSLCNSSYSSLRSLALFRNTLTIQKFIYFYIQKPKEIYSSRYKTWLISTNGLVCRYISVVRLDDLSKLSNMQLIFILFIEIQDLIIPQIEKSLLVFSKVILYVFISFLGNGIIFCIRTILAGIHSLHK